MSFLRHPVIQKAKAAPKEPQQRESTNAVSVPFLLVAEYWQLIEETPKRLQKTEYFTKLLIRLDSAYKDDIPLLFLLLSNKIRDPWDELPCALNFGEMMVKKAIQEAFSVKPDEMRASVLKTGDLAFTCEQFKKRQPKQFVQARELTLMQIISDFRRIADAINTQNDDRLGIAKRLLLSGNSLEDRYIVRLLVGKNRLGLERKTMLFALSEFLTFKSLKLEFSPTDNEKEEMDRIWSKITAYQVSNKTIDELDNADAEEEEDDATVNVDYAELGLDQLLSLQGRPSAQIDQGNPRQHAYLQVSKAFAKVPSLPWLSQNIGDLVAVRVTPFIPILPMLAKPVSSYDELLEQSTSFYAEYKYDGFRAQVHCLDGKYQIYSRQEENMSSRFPDVLESVKLANLGNRSFILDGEIVPVDAGGEILPFQMLSRRLKVFDESAQNTSKITYFCFDVMLLNGTELLDAPFAARRQILAKSFKAAGNFQLSKEQLCSNLGEIEAFLQEAVQHKTEGLIVKAQGSRYAPDRRSKHWTKLKKDYLDAVGDSFDLVPVGAWYGKGKRTGVIGSYLLACRNGDVFQTVTCTGTGMSDEFLQSQEWNKKENVPKSVVVSEKYSGSAKPDFWIDPEDSRVWEIKVANLSISKVHTCYLKDGEGIAARLPRLVRARDDKPVSECSTAQFIFERFMAEPDRKEGPDEINDGEKSFSNASESV